MEYRISEVLLNLQTEYQLVDQSGEEYRNKEINPEGGEIKILCPYHQDSRPSFFVNATTGMGYCHACGTSKNFPQLIATLRKVPIKAAEAYLKQHYGVSSEKSLAMNYADDSHFNLMNPRKDPQLERRRQELVKALKERGVSADMQKKFKLGMANGRIAIPVFNDEGFLVNVRQHLPGELCAEDDSKVINMKGFGANRIYPLSQLNYNKILICGGELKAIAASEELNKHDIGCVTQTGGETNWTSELLNELADKEVYVCLDIDATGEKHSAALCKRLLRKAARVYEIVLPLDKEKFPNGDINDYIALGEQLYPLVEGAMDYRHLMDLEKKFDHEDPEPATLKALKHPSSLGRRKVVKALPTQQSQDTYTVPKVIEIDCPEGKSMCEDCGKIIEGNDTFEIPAESQAVLEIIGKNRQNLIKALKVAARIPERCRLCTFNYKENHAVQELMITPELDLGSITTGAGEVLTTFHVGTDNVDSHEVYELTGQMFSHPDTQAMTFVTSKCEPVADVLETYEPANAQMLEVFKPAEWTKESVMDRLNAKYQDLEANVTRIFKRRRMHLAFDLAYHSPLYINFDGKRRPGWVEVLIIGDSEQGKSEVANCLLQHYQLGAKVECKGATPAGLIAGVEQRNGQWYVTWGAFPTHDKRLLILEELKGMPEESFAKLTEVRSSGRAQITKVARRSAHARVRVVALSNPRDSREIGDYSYGVNSIKTLIGSLEDIRRFDYFVVAARTDVDLEEVQMFRPQMPHRYNSELCKELLLWAWSVEKVVFEDERYLKQQSIEFCSNYENEIPIIGTGSGHIKIAKLSASLAAMTFSYTAEKELMVRNCHVDAIIELLTNTYNADNFGLDRYSKAKRSNAERYDKELVLKTLQNVPDSKTVALYLRDHSTLLERHLEVHLGVDHDGVREFLSRLASAGAITANRNRYGGFQKINKFTKDLVDYCANGEHTKRPDFVEGDF